MRFHISRGNIARSVHGPAALIICREPRDSVKMSVGIISAARVIAQRRAAALVSARHGRIRFHRAAVIALPYRQISGTFCRQGKEKSRREGEFSVVANGYGSILSRAKPVNFPLSILAIWIFHTVEYLGSVLWEEMLYGILTNKYDKSVWIVAETVTQKRNDLSRFWEI